MKNDYQPDSRDFVPPRELAHVFRLIQDAKDAARRPLGSGYDYESAVDNLIEAVEDLAKYMADEKGRHAP